MQNYMCNDHVIPVKIEENEKVVKVNVLDGNYAELEKQKDGLDYYYSHSTDIGYPDEDIVGLHVDFKNNIFKRLSAAHGLEAGDDFDKFPMYGGRRRCTVADDGTITSWYGDANFVEDGSIGQVMVYQPAFYYRMVPLELEPIEAPGFGYHIIKANWFITDKPRKNFKLHPAFYDEDGNPVDYCFFSAYAGAYWDESLGKIFHDNVDNDRLIDYDNDKLLSVSGAKPISGFIKDLNRISSEKLANNLGDGWHISTVKLESMNQLLMAIELGNMKTQKSIGLGVVQIPDGNQNRASITGSTSMLGNKTGMATKTINDISGNQTAYSSNGMVSISYRGIEDFWGNIWRYVNGANCWGDGNMLGGQIYIAKDFNFSDTKHDDNYLPVGFTIANRSGYISKLGYGKEDYDYLFMASMTGGNSENPIGDDCTVRVNTSVYSQISLAGSWNVGVRAGGYYWYFATVNKYRDLGARLIYIPQTKRRNKK